MGRDIEFAAADAILKVLCGYGGVESYMAHTCSTAAAGGCNLNNELSSGPPVLVSRCHTGRTWILLQNKAWGSDFHPSLFGPLPKLHTPFGNLRN